MPCGLAINSLLIIFDNTGFPMELRFIESKPNDGSTRRKLRPRFHQKAGRGSSRAVSAADVKLMYPERKDIYSPDELFRSAGGQIIYCKALMRW